MLTEHVVVFEHVSKYYANRWMGGPLQQAVADVSFHIERGEVFGLLGPNRAGKTTLVKLLLSLCRATDGRVTRFGRPVSDRRTLEKVGYLHERAIFPGYLSASELLEYYAALAGSPRGESRTRASALLERLGLADRSREPIARFSKGMVQRLGIAQALMKNPDFLILDEPTEGMDLPGRAQLPGLLSDPDRPGRTVLLITHDAELAGRLCDRVAVLDAGRLVFLGRPSDLPRDRSGLSFAGALEALFARRIG